MSLFTKLVKKSLKDFLQRRRKWFIAMGLFLAGLVATNFFLNQYVGKLIGTLIKEFVQEKSNGFYHVDFKEIAYILNSGTFYVSEFQFEIHPDYKQNLVYDDLPQQYLYSSSIPSLHIDIVDFWSIFVRRKLTVIGIQITSPYIKITNLNKTKAPKKISFEAGNLYSILSEHLNELKINDFLISDGEFDYETYNGADYDNFKIRGLTFEVNNFRINEKASSRKDKIFYTDDIFLQVKDQIFYLKDSIHKVTFDKFYISTSENEFGFENFNLTRRENPHIKVQDHDHYEISIPSLKLSGIDFVNAYNNNLLVLDSIHIADPMINIKKRTNRQSKDSTRNNLLDLAMIYHDYLMINHFKLDDANLIFTDETNEIPKQYSIDHISAHVTKVEIDTVSNSTNHYGFNFDEAELLVKDYEVNLPDSVNTVKFDEFSISSNPFEIKLKGLTINPTATSGQSNKKNLIYAAIPYLVIKDFDVAQAINKDTFLIDEIYLENPEIKVVQVEKQEKSTSAKQNPGGLFGIYEIIQNNSKHFFMEKMKLVNGKVGLERSKDSIRLSLDNINMEIENLKVDSMTNTQSDVLGDLTIDLSLNGSSFHIPETNVKLNHLAYNSHKTRLEIKDLEIASYRKEGMQEANLNVPQLLLTGIDLNEILYDNKISLDTLKFVDVKVFIDLVKSSRAEKKENDKSETNLPVINIDHLVGIDYDVKVEDSGFPLFNAENIKFNISGLIIDQSLSNNPINQFDYAAINLISVDYYDLFLRNQQHIFRSNNIFWNNYTNTFSIENLSLKPIANTNNKYNIEIPKITMSGINLKKVLKESFYEGDKIIIDQPQINLKLARGRQEKPTSLDLGFIPLLLRNRYHGAKSNTFEVRNATVNFHQKAEADSVIIESENINLFVDLFEVDSTTEMLPERFLFANDVRLDGDYLSVYDQKNSDFFNINHYVVSTNQGNIKLDDIYFSTNTKNESPEKGHLRLTIDNLNLLGFDFYNLTQNRALELEEIQIANADVFYEKNNTENNAKTPSDSLERELQKYNLITPDKKEIADEAKILDKISKSLEKQLNADNLLKTTKKKKLNLNHQEYLFDTLLLKSIEIDKILLTDSKLDYETTDDHNTGLLIPDIWLLAEGVKYDPIVVKDSSRIFYTDNLVAKISNFNYVLPDNLSAINVDELILNSRDSTIKANNFALMPLVGKYDYGIAKGFQSTWLKIENDSISLKKVDFLGLMNQQKFNAESLNVNKLNISVFRDKRNPFPEWQRRPLPQTNLRELNFKFGIDTINVFDGFITYQEHSEKAYTTGEVFFSDMNAKIINLTNDSIKTINNSNAKIGVTTKIFGEGPVKGEFLFDLVNMENIHSYGIDVDPFDLTEFNRILIPSASVQITSGESNKIIMAAKANEDYSYGEMKFYYENLKIQLLNRETETPKGLGNALGSFFANTFIIRSNNPRNLFLRKGDIFFERDKKRAIFNYWTKTFLSGVVSSIGATNNKKKIKRMQDENLQKIQNEKDEIWSE